MAVASRAMRGVLSETWNRHQRTLAPYIFIAPFFILFVIFFLGPVIFAFYLSFTSWVGVGAPKWVGLDNFADLAVDETFLASTYNTVWYAVVALALLIPSALVLATILNGRNVRLSNMWRALYFLPGITSIVAVTVVFVLVYNTQYGFVNFALRLVGLPPLAWLTESLLVKPAIVLVIFWRRLGFTMVYFLAGLQAIPQEMYEAAVVDGANRRQLFWNITVPLLRPMLVFVAVITTINAFQTFDEPFLLTGGGPGADSLSMAQYLYRVGFTFGKLGYGSAVGTILFFVIMAVSIVQMRLLGAFRED